MRKSMQQDRYENKLRASGMEQIGSGLYSNVFAKLNSDKAVKVACLDAWPEYILWATRNGHAGKFAPKVYSLKFHDEFYVAVMERLVCTIADIQREQCCPAQIYTYCEFGRYYKEEITAEDLVDYVSHLRDIGIANDLHDGNVMLRHDGQMVITDPYSGGGSSRFRIKHGVCL